jgi:glycerophosphoryl diester phosphodiesterase
VRTGARKPPRGYARDDFAIPALEDVLREFPRVAMNIEIKGRDGDDAAVYRRTAELLAGVLKRTRRTDIIVASFDQPAIDRFHELAPRVPVAPGIDGTAAFVLSGGSPGPGVAAFQVPITFQFGGQKLIITTPDFVKRAHEAGYAVHVWLSNDREDDATYRRLLGMCVDGIMAAKPGRLARVLRSLGAARTDPCGTRVAAAKLSAGPSLVSVPLRRVGASLERRSGDLRLYDRRTAALLGSATWTLASGALKIDATVKLTAEGRAMLRGGRTLAARADVLERGRTVRRQQVTLS